MSHHCDSCKRKSKKNYLAYSFKPFGLSTWYYDDETVFEVTDDEGNTVPQRHPEFDSKHGGTE